MHLSSTSKLGYLSFNICVSSNEAVCIVFMMVFGRPGRDANPRPTARESDTHTTISYHDTFL